MLNHNMMEKTLNLLFRNRYAERCALEFLTAIGDRERCGDPLSDSEWNEWLKKHGFRDSTYQNVRSSLIEQGLIAKKDRRFHLSTSFIVELERELFEVLGIAGRG